jgi:drug/metabolite transporter (DMT)-like permease
MLSLLLSILSSTAILWIFKLIEKEKIALLPPIIVNYMVGSVLGFIISGSQTATYFQEIPPWVIYSLLIGLMLIGNFYLIGSSTQKAGVAVTSIAAKMSFVLPVLFSLFYDKTDYFSNAKIILLLLAVISMILVVFPKKAQQVDAKNILLPIALFFGLGVLDSIIKYCQYHYISNPESSSVFSAFNFSVAGILGIGILFTNKTYRTDLKKLKIWFFGALLGIANFGSMYFLINALNDLKFNNSMVFGINNLGVILFAVLLGMLLFKERFSRINWVGFILSLLVLLGMIRLF